MAKNKITKLRQSALQRELLKLNEEVKSAKERLVLAKEEGDLSENSGVDASKMAIGIAESKIAEINQILDTSEVFEDTSGSVIDVGSFIRVEQKNEENGEFLPPELYMVDSTYGFGIIATDCALGKVILGNLSGTYTVQTAMGDTKTYRVIKDNSNEALEEFLRLNPPDRKVISGNKA